MKKDDYEFTHGGRKYRCTGSAPHASAVSREVAAPRADPPRWTLEVDGKQYLGFEVRCNELDSDETKEMFRNRVIEFIRQSELKK